MKMPLYDVLVKLGDQAEDAVVHSAPRSGVTEMEIRLLKKIHGPQAIVKSTKVGEVERDEQTEIWRLCTLYKPAKVASGLGVEVTGYDQYADDQRAIQEEEMKARQEQRAENQRRADAEVAAAGVAAVLGKDRPQAQPEQAAVEPPKAPAAPKRDREAAIA